jgi:hypothetical protein
VEAHGAHGLQEPPLAQPATTRGRQKKKIVVGGWVRVTKKGCGQIYFFTIVFVVFLNSYCSPRNAQKRDKKNREKIGFGFWVEFFDTIFVCIFFCSVFELPSLRNTRKRDKTKKVEEKLTSEILSIFLKGFRHGLFTNMFLWCF